MRKHLSLVNACMVIMAILLCFSIGYTYAYFSAIKVVTGDAKVARIDVSWRDANNNDAGIVNTFDNSTTTTVNEALAIDIKGELRRGGFIEIKEEGKTDAQPGLKLKIANITGTVGAYCRVKIDVKYTPKNTTTVKTCPVGWIQLALDNDLTDTTDPELITDSGNWCLYNDYYYYGELTTSGGTPTLDLTALAAKSGVDVANFIYLSQDADADIFGASLSITLTLEAVQTTHDAYKSVWNLA